MNNEVIEELELKWKSEWEHCLRHAGGVAVLLHLRQCLCPVLTHRRPETLVVGGAENDNFSVSSLIEEVWCNFNVDGFCSGSVKRRMIDGIF